MIIAIIKIEKSDKIDELLEQENMSRAELARRVGVHRSYITKLLNEDKICPEKLYRKIVTVFGKV